MKTLYLVVTAILLSAVMIYAADYTGSATGPELDYVHGVTGPVQTQLNNQQTQLSSQQTSLNNQQMLLNNQQGHFQNYSGHDHATPIVTVNMTGNTSWWQSVKTTLATYFNTLYHGLTIAGSEITTALGFTPENVANKSTDGTMAGNSATLYPSQSAVVTYVGAHAGLSGSLPWANLSSAVLKNPMNIPTGPVANGSPTAFPTDQQVQQWSAGFSNWSTSLRANSATVGTIVGASGGGGTNNTIYSYGYGPILTDSTGAKWLLAVSTSGVLSASAYTTTWAGFSDSFTGSAGNLSASWTTVTGTSAPQLTGSGSVRGNGTNDSWALYTAATTPANQYAELDGITYSGAYANSIAGVIVRGATSGYSGYVGMLGATGGGVVTAQIYRYGGSSPGSVYASSTLSPSNEYSKIKLDVQGTGTSTTLTFTAWNGTSWTTLYTGADTSGGALSAGQPGIRLNSYNSGYPTAGPFSAGTP